MYKNCFVILCLIVVFCTQVFACRIVPVIRPDEPVIISQPAVLPIQVKDHRFDVTIKDGVAVTVLETVFYNPNNRILEGTYLFPLPKGASVAQFSMWIDGKEMQGELLDSNKARDLYVSIVRRMIDPGLLEFVGRETFKMSIFPIPACGDKKVKLSYQQVLPKDNNLMRYVYPLTTVGNGREDTLGTLSFNVNITSQIPLKSIFSPSHKVKLVKEDNKATVTFQETSVHPDRDFTLYISSSDTKLDLSFVPFCKQGSDNGYFMLMLAPKVKTEPLEQNPKDVVFVFDTSGSMHGEKIKQAQEALKYCLNSLKEGDRFNIIPFSTEVRPFKTNLVDVSKNTIKEAFDFVAEDVFARGGTAIEEALITGLNMAPKTGNRPYMMVFLTDGRPTVGERDPERLLEMVKKANCANLRLFAFGVGEELDVKLLDRLAEENRGAREYVGPQEDIEIKVSSLFDKISSPVLSNIKIQLPSTNALRISEVYPRTFPDMFKGSQVTMLGRYSGNGDQLIKLTGNVGEKQQEFTFEVSFPKENTDNDQIPRIWATRKIGYLLDQIRMNGEDQELKKEVVELAKKFGIVTPYTSYLVLEDDARISQQPPRPGVVVPVPQSAWRGEEFDRESKRTLEKAKSEMKEDSGEGAVSASKHLNEMRNADIAAKPSEGRDKGGFAPLAKVMKAVDEKTFYLRDNVWYDSEYKDTKDKTRIRYMSDEYFKLLQEKPGIGKFLAIGSRVVIVFENQVYEIYEQ